MFKNLIINFSEPICKCNVQDLGWTIICKNNKFDLCVWCNLCAEEIIIPQNKLYASLEFNKPYDDIHYPKDNIIRVDFSKR